MILVDKGKVRIVKMPRIRIPRTKVKPSGKVYNRQAYSKTIKEEL